MHSRYLVSVIRPTCEKFLGEYQHGFVENRYCAHGINTVAQLQEKAAKRRESLCCVYIDFAKAFDSVPRELAWEVLSKLGVPPKIVEILRQLNCENVGKMAGSLHNQFTLSRGVRQKSCEGPILFTVVLELILRAAKLPGELGCQVVPCSVVDGVKFGYLNDNNSEPFRVPISGFADDLAILDESPERLSQAIDALRNVSDSLGIELNEAKTVFQWLCNISPAV